MMSTLQRGNWDHRTSQTQAGYLVQLFRNLFYQKEMKARSEALKTLEIKIKYSWCILENQDYTSSLTPFYTNKYSSVFQTMINN